MRRPPRYKAASVRRRYPHAFGTLIRLVVMVQIAGACDAGSARKHPLQRDGVGVSAAARDSADIHDEGVNSMPIRPAVRRTSAPLQILGKQPVLQLVGDTLRASIEWAYTNDRGTPLLNPGCYPPTTPRLQWWTGTGWRDAYDVISYDCLSVPFVIAPRARHVDTVEVRAMRRPRGTNARQHDGYWRASLHACVRFRLIWDLYEIPKPTGGSPLSLGAPLPESLRASERFLLPERESERAACP